MRVCGAVHHLAGVVQVHGGDLARIGPVDDQLGVGAARRVATHHGEVAVAGADVEAFQVRHLGEHAGGEALDGGLAVGDGVAGHHVAGDQRRLGRRAEIAAHLPRDARLQRVQHRLGQRQGAGPVRLVAVGRDAEDGQDDERHAQHGAADAQQGLTPPRHLAAADVNDLVDGR